MDGPNMRRMWRISLICCACAFLSVSLAVALGGNGLPCETDADCDDNNPCTDDLCDFIPDGESWGVCDNLPNSDPCDDGDACTVVDACSGGQCLPGAARDCDDLLDCTLDSCEPVQGCIHTPDDALCQFGPCTVGVCSPTTGCTPTGFVEYDWVVVKSAVPDSLEIPLGEARTVQYTILAVRHDAGLQPTTGGCDDRALVRDGLHCPPGFACTPSDPGPWEFSYTGTVSYVTQVENVAAPCGLFEVLRNRAELQELGTHQVRRSFASVRIHTGPCPPRCGDGNVDAAAGETCDPPGSAAGASGNVCRDDCTVCGDGIAQQGEACDDGNDISTDFCRNDCSLNPAGCRVTGGGVIFLSDGETYITDPSIMAQIDRASFGGQAGAPVGLVGCDAGAAEIAGQWTHLRHRRRGSLHASRYLSLACGCANGPVRPENLNGNLCGPSNGEPGPEPPATPANVACFTGVGQYNRQSNRTGGGRTTAVAFRVYVEDRAEPGGGGNAGSTADFYRMEIWLTNGSEAAAQLARDACCASPRPGLPAPDIIDAGHLVRGNIQVHPAIGR